MLETLNEVARLVLTDDIAAIRRRYDEDAQLTVPDEFVSFIDGTAVPARLPA